jgi:hypothetical protein
MTMSVQEAHDSAREVHIYFDPLIGGITTTCLRIGIANVVESTLRVAVIAMMVAVDFIQVGVDLSYRHCRCGDPTWRR